MQCAEHARTNKRIICCSNKRERERESERARERRALVRTVLHGEEASCMQAVRELHASCTREHRAHIPSFFLN